MKHLKLIMLAIMATFFMTACSDDDDDADLRTTSFTYTLNNGQAAEAFAYAGTHPGDLTATLKIDEMENGNGMVTVTLNNTISGATYHTHAHDAADPSTTPNGTPYNETPNDDVYAQAIVGTGSTASASQESAMSYSALTSSYQAFFVVHDPLQAVNTADPTTYVILNGFSKAESQSDFQSTTFPYSFNDGSFVEAFGYEGTHPSNLSGQIRVTELAGGKSRIIVDIMNTIDGEIYRSHAHDAADASTTPNGTPYNETPNGDVFAMPITGNGGMASGANVSDLSYSDVTSSYEGFFVVHDPLQAVNTADPTTYVLLGSFAR